MELWDIYDLNGNVTGRTIERGGRALEKGELHHVVEICVFNGKGELLLQKRSDSKPNYPSVWEFSAGGSAIAGETGFEAIRRETLEEIGYDIGETLIAPKLRMYGEKGFTDYYVVSADFDISSLHLQTEEVSAVMWADKERLLELNEKGETVPYNEHLIELLFDMRSA